MESGAKGCEVIVSGKLHAQRAKSMKFKDGYMISSGQPVKEYIDSAVRHVLLRQGVLGIKVKIMLDSDPKGKQGPVTPLPDLVTIHPPEEETYSFIDRCPSHNRSSNSYSGGIKPFSPSTLTVSPEGFVFVTSNP